eukprot:485817-Rhodomonas_salina.2
MLCDARYLLASLPLFYASGMRCSALTEAAPLSGDEAEWLLVDGSLKRHERAPRCSALTPRMARLASTRGRRCSKPRSYPGQLRCRPARGVCDAQF